MTVRHRWRWFRFGMMTFAGFCLTALAGCGGCGGIVIQPPEKKPNQGDPLEMGREILQKADGLAGYKEGLEQFNRYLHGHSDALQEHRLSKEDRAVLKEHFGLDADELRQMEATDFQKLDSHYLELCYLLRDAARSLQLQHLPPLEQARRCFDWVCRQVVLREAPGEPLQPPLWALKRGFGSAQDRAVVFAELLRQIELDAAMLALPGDKGGVRYWAPAVLVEDRDRSDLHVFDTRLGLPLPGPKSGVATLAQLKAQPTLLRQLDVNGFTYDVTDKALAGAEVRLICPLTALAPRMRFLEADLAPHDKVRLALRPAELLRRFAKAGVPVKVWNAPPIIKGGQRELEISPTRVLRVNLPPDEGGIGSPLVYRSYLVGLTQWAPIDQTLAQLNMRTTLGDRGEDLLAGLIGEVVRRFALAPRESLERGRIDEAHKRLEKIHTVLGDFAAAQLGEAEFQAKLAEWREGARAAVRRWAQEGQGNPQALLQGFAAEDQYLVQLLFASEDLEFKEKPHKTALSFVVFRAVGDPLRREVTRLQALRYHEIAVRRQATADRRGTGPDKEEARETWSDASGLWKNYSDRVPLTAATLAVGLQGVRDAAARARAEPGYTRAQTLPDSLAHFLQKELRQSAAAGLLAANCQEKAEKAGDQGAAVALGRLAGQLADLRRSPEVQRFLELYPTDTRADPARVVQRLRGRRQLLLDRVRRPPAAAPPERQGRLTASRRRRLTARMELLVDRLEPVAIHVRVMLRCLNAGVAEQFLHGTQVGAAGEQVRRETMP